MGISSSKFYVPNLFYIESWKFICFDGFNCTGWLTKTKQIQTDQTYHNCRALLEIPYIWNILDLLNFLDLLQQVKPSKPFLVRLFSEGTILSFVMILFISKGIDIAWSLFCPRSTLVVLFISICTWFAVEERVQNETWIMWRRGGGGGVATKTYRLTLNLRNPSSLSHERPFLWTFVFMWQLVAQFYEGRHSKRGENETWQMAD